MYDPDDVADIRVQRISLYGLVDNLQLRSVDIRMSRVILNGLLLG